MTNAGEKSEKDQKTKKLNQILEAIRSPITVGLVVTAILVYSAKIFYQIRSQNDAERKPSILFDLVEWADLKSMDMRFKWRGEVQSQAPVALLTIDDRSLEEVGRWPWSREKTAFVIDQLFQNGAKALGLDIVFSEPQIDSTLETLERVEQVSSNAPAELRNAIAAEKLKAQPDLALAQTIEKYKEKIVLGAFTDETTHRFLPYQDYCRNEAFKRANADQFVKLNATFIVNDEADHFVDLEFEKVLTLIFEDLEKKNTDSILQSKFQNKPIDRLTPQEINQLKYYTEEANMDYCDQWLLSQDSYLQPSEKIYLQIFEKSEHLKGLDLHTAIAKFKSMVKSHPIVQHRRWTINTNTLQTPADYTGSFNAEQDSDGTIRKASMFFRTGNRIGTSFIPSLSLQTFLIATGLQARIEINNDPRHSNQKALTKFQIYDPSKDPEVLYADIPVDSQGRLKINYAGGKNMFPYVPARELFTNKKTMTISQTKYIPQLGRWIIQEEEVDKAKFIKDRAFIFGATAIGVYDLRVTPYEKNFPGPETHVNSLANLFDRNFIRTYADEHIWMPWLLAAIGILFTVAVSHTGAVSGFILTLALGGITVWIDSFLFKKGLFVTIVLPFFLVTGLYIILTFYKYFTEERKKRHLRSTFSKYVSPAIVDEILKDPENIELGGKKQRMSVMFSDVRGFTTISEKLDPQVLSDVLNRYLTPMTQLVFANKGTLDKYMGDAIMAFFGAPVFYPDHAKYACRCALQMIEKLKEIQEQYKKEGLPEIDIGIGLNTAEMSVGNMGSDIVRSYTVMGDAVNLGSRLEGINKEYGTRIIISEFTYKDIRDSFTAREVDWVRVKGKNEPVRIYELICEGPPTDEWKDCIHYFNQGFDLYHQKNFAKAKTCFESALKARPGDPVSELYIERCDEYMQEPPPENWDGVFVMKTK